MREAGEQIWVHDGPTVRFLGIPYPTRMAVVRLPGGGLWVWSPTALDPELAEELEGIGPVRHLVAPNKLHHLFLSPWLARWPEAKLWAAPGLARRRPDLPVRAELGDAPPEEWLGEIDQVPFRGSWFMTEIVFFHRRSSTALVADLIERFEPGAVRGWRGLLLRMDGLVGERGSTPREWRLTFLDRRAARECRDRILAWEPRALIVAHGMCAWSGAAEVIRAGLRWL